jgi:hypothetical protein
MNTPPQGITPISPTGDQPGCGGSQAGFIARPPLITHRPVPSFRAGFSPPRTPEDPQSPLIPPFTKAVWMHAPRLPVWDRRQDGTLAQPSSQGPWTITILGLICDIGKLRNAVAPGLDRPRPSPSAHLNQFVTPGGVCQQPL